MPKRIDVEPMPDGDGLPATEPEYWTADAMRVADHFFERSGAGRPPKLADHKLIATIMALVAGGAAPSDAAAQLGISPSNFTTWQERGSGPQADAGYVQFSELLNKAREVGKNWHVRNIHWHARKNWVPSAWWLERNFPDQFGKRSAVDVTHTHLRGTGRPEIKEIPITSADLMRTALMLQGAEPAQATIEQEPVTAEYRELSPTE